MESSPGSPVSLAERKIMVNSCVREDSLHLWFPQVFAICVVQGPNVSVHQRLEPVGPSMLEIHDTLWQPHWKLPCPEKNLLTICTCKFLCFFFFKGKILLWISSEVIWDLFKHLALIRKQENMSKLDPIWTGFVYPSHLEFKPQILVLTSS